MKYISIENSDKPLIVDDEDFEIVKGYKWHLHKNYIRFTKKPQLAIHRLIMGAKKGQSIDHINGDFFDNRRCNLRFATKQQNNWNKRINPKNKTGAIGVYWSKDASKYRARIGFNGKTINLGYFETVEDARDAYIEASNKYFGDYSYYNSRGMPNTSENPREGNKKISVGDLIKFKSEKIRYAVQACNERFIVCTKPFNVRKTVLYTIVDLQNQIRGPENLIFCMGFETKEDCEEALMRLSKDESEISHRNRIPLDIEAVTYKAKDTQ
jgi:hypothetical protein